MKQKARGLALASLIFIIGPFWWNTGAGDRVLTPAEAWQVGASHSTILSGVALLLLSVFLYRGAKWAPWLIMLWCPASILTAIGWDAAIGLATPSWGEFFIGGVPVMLFWVLASWRYMIKENEPGHAASERG